MSHYPNSQNNQSLNDETPDVGSSDGNFERELTSLLNRFCKENDSNTPDFILAEYIQHCLGAYNRAVTAREKWYGR